MRVFYLCKSVIGPMSPYALKYDMYRLCFVLIFSILFVFLISRKERFASGINLVAANIAIVLSFLSMVYCYSINLEGEFFDVWRSASPDIYMFSVEPVFSGVLTFSIGITFVSMFFLIRCWIRLLFNLKGDRNWMAAYILFFVSIVIMNFQYRVLSCVKPLKKELIYLTENYLKKIDATEEMTKRHSQENKKSWSANFLRAQFLWDTKREKESLEYYKKAYSLLDVEDRALKAFIEGRIKNIQ